MKLSLLVTAAALATSAQATYGHDAHLDGGAKVEGATGHLGADAGLSAGESLGGSGGADAHIGAGAQLGGGVGSKGGAGASLNAGAGINVNGGLNALDLGLGSGDFHFGFDIGGKLTPDQCFEAAKQTGQRDCTKTVATQAYADMSVGGRGYHLEGTGAWSASIGFGDVIKSCKSGDNYKKWCDGYKGAYVEQYKFKQKEIYDICWKTGLHGGAGINLGGKSKPGGGATAGISIGGNLGGHGSGGAAIVGGINVGGNAGGHGGGISLGGNGGGVGVGIGIGGKPSPDQCFNVGWNTGRNECSNQTKIQAYADMSKGEKGYNSEGAGAWKSSLGCGIAIEGCKTGAHLKSWCGGFEGGWKWEFDYHHKDTYDSCWNKPKSPKPSPPKPSNGASHHKRESRVATELRKRHNDQW